MRELWLWAGHLPKAIKTKLQKSVVDYLNGIINEGWHKTELGEVSPELEKAIKDMGDAVSELDSQQAIYSSRAFSLFVNVVNYRERRIRFG